MNKSELIEAIAKETELSKAAAGRALEVVLSTIVKTVAKKQDVQLIGFGTFKAAKRTARTGKNPRTGAADLPPTSRTKLRLVKSVNLEQDGHEEEQIYRRTDHWLSQAG